MAAAVLAVPGLASAQAPSARIEGDLPNDLRAAIEQAVGESDRPLTNRFEARRRAREAAEDAITVLRSRGYYAYEVESDIADGDDPWPVVRITPGPQFRFAAPTIEWVGAPPDTPIPQTAHEAMAIQPGAPGRAADIISAEGRIIAHVSRRGYADAEAGERDVIVDHAVNEVRPTFRIAAGDLVRLDGLRLAQPGRTRLRWLQRLAPWRTGDPYHPEHVAELERRLLDTGVYETVTVAVAPREQTTEGGLRPVIVSLADRPPRTIELGASYATDEGFGLDARWTRYNVLGRADTLQVTGRISELDNRLAADLTLPHWRRAQENLRVGAAIFQLETDAFDETGATINADLTRRLGRTSYFTYGGSLAYSRTDELRQGEPSPLGEDLFIVAGLAALVLDRSNDPLDPTRGWRFDGRAEPTVLIGDDTLPYLRLMGQARAYFPFGEEARTVFAARLRLGSILGGSIPEVPASRRFFAGGGGSVRGYPFQAVGPRHPDNTPRGGLSLAEASLELRQRITERWGAAVFVDAGAVSLEQYPTGEEFSVGAGFGVRYDLGFGPIRADIAIPLNPRRGDPAFQVYLSIGQSF